MGDGGWVEVEGVGDVGEGGGGDDGVFEEGARAAAIGVSGDEEHAFGLTDCADGVVDLEGRGLVVGEMLLEVGVVEAWGGAGVEAEGDAGDDVAVAVGGVEDALAVGEVAVGGGEGGEGVGREIEGADGGDGLGDLLAVGSYVLDGGSADEAGDAGEALDAAEVGLGYL